MNPDEELNQIVQRSKEALDRLCTYFSANPKSFFTEADLAAYFTHFFLQVDGNRTYPDGNGVQHGLVHAEYPTPFRCGMKGYECTIMSEDTRTPKGGKYKRGHYDVAILNPNIRKKSRNPQ